MFYTMVFYKNEFGFSNARALRKPPYKTLKGAIKAIQRSGLQGYVKEHGKSLPVWQNLANTETVERIKNSNSVPLDNAQRQKVVVVRATL